MAYIRVFICVTNSITISVCQCCVGIEDVDLNLISQVVALDVEEKKNMIVRRSLAHATKPA